MPLLGTPNWSPGSGLSADGRLVVADKDNAYAVGALGELLWQRDNADYSEEFLSYLSTQDALIGEQNAAFIGGYHSDDVECLHAGLVRMEW